MTVSWRVLYIWPAFQRLSDASFKKSPGSGLPNRILNRADKPYDRVVQNFIQQYWIKSLTTRLKRTDIYLAIRCDLPRPSLHLPWHCPWRRPPFTSYVASSRIVASSSVASSMGSSPFPIICNAERISLSQSFRLKFSVTALVELSSTRRAQLQHDHVHRIKHAYASDTSDTSVLLL